MPELPEAETIARSIHAKLAGRRFAEVVHCRADIIRHDDARLTGVEAVPGWLAGSVVEAVGRRGKRVVFRLTLPGDRNRGNGESEESAATAEWEYGLIVFLGMTGHLSVAPVDQPPIDHTHLRIALADRSEELRFSDYRRFGGVQFYKVRPGQPPAGLAGLGDEPIGMPLRRFRELCGRNRQIKALLMDQAIIAGLGNIYCDEALHRSGIHPLTVASRVPAEQVRRLHRAIQAVLTSAIRFNGTTVINYQHPEGSGQFQKRLRVYGHAGEPCRNCGEEIVTMVAAGRTTHLCPVCQPRRGRRVKRTGG